MSAKWRAIQHRHRFTYNTVVFPQSYVETLNLWTVNSSSSKFFTELNHLISLNSIYSQITTAKKLASAFVDSLTVEPLDSVAIRLYLQILFLDNSLPLHRTLISVLAKNPNRSSHSAITSCFRLLCGEYGVSNGAHGKRFVVSRVVLSLMGVPKIGFLNEAIEECSVSVAVDIGYSLRTVIAEIEGGSRPSPSLMEQCQEALSCLYYLLQRFPLNFVDSDAFEVVLMVVLDVLKSSAFPRDCLVAAGVSFCAALQAFMSPAELTTFISEAFFSLSTCNYSISSENRCDDSGFTVPFKSFLYSAIRDFLVLSRLCVLRGMLTAVPRTMLNTHFVKSEDGLNGFDVHGSSSDSVWTILYDGILPELCNFCENPIDTHFNFHALTVTQICLQQIKTSILSNITNLSGNYDPFPEDMASRILRVIWNNLEDPLSQTVKQVHLIFDLFLDIQSALCPVECTSKRTKSFLLKTASDLLRLGGRCKGRYVPLASLTRRLGAKTILDMNPNILFETTNAYIDDDVCCAATLFLKCILECLRDECWSSDGIERGYEKFRGLCLPPILYGLVSGISKLRSNLTTYVLPLVLEVDVDSIFPMLAFISVGLNKEESETIHPELAGAKKDLTVDQCVAALVSLLKVARLLALIEGDIDWCHPEENGKNKENFTCLALVCVKGIDVTILGNWLVLALTHVDDSLRIDAAESLFLNPKTSSLPSPLELCLMKEAVPLNMRSCSTAFQMKWASLFRKLFSRVRTALERQVKLGCWQPLAICNGSENAPDNDANDTVIRRAENLFGFMKWLSCFLLFSCYPSAPYERKTMAMELILIMINVWPIIPPQNNYGLYPYTEGFTSVGSTLSLVGSIVDSWDRLRESSFRILLHFPTPLPGISDQDAVKEVIKWAKKLVCSPRVRESDAGALTMRLIFRKYVLELGWMVGASVKLICLQPEPEMVNGDPGPHLETCKIGVPVIDYILSLVDWLSVIVKEGERDLSEACKNSFVHGVLLTIRYTFEELDWNSEAVLANSCEMRHALEKLLELVMRITSLALWVVSADAWYLPEDMDDIVDESAFLLDIPVEIYTPESSSRPELQVKNLKVTDNAGPADQVVMVGCWLAMKEVSLLLGTIIRKIPLPRSSTSFDSSNPGDPLCVAADVQPMTLSDLMLDLKQLETIGNHFLEVLLKMKHNGAIDKTRAGFTALCNRLLCSNDPRLCKMTESWMEQLMERTVAKGQTVDDLLRRSAGIPAAFIAFFLSEPEGTPKKLLPRALRWLIDLASMFLASAGKINDKNADFSYENNVTEVEQVSVSGEKSSKIRNEGVIPTVHAFNSLKAAFNDTNLAADVSGFSAEALIISIRSFSSPYWEVRNSACLAYTALVRRMIGFLNVQKRESARRALTGLEFFHRYPALHPFLFRELEIATDLLGDRSTRHPESNIAKVVHPSLCPVLILLCRLKPSPICSETEDTLDPFLFMPFIRRCATQSNLRLRVLASRALTGLVSNEKLHTVLLKIARGLPPHGQSPIEVPEPISVNISNGDEIENEMAIFPSFNCIHGMLLQLNSLLDINCKNLINVSKKDQILDELIQVLVKCSWIGSSKSCPCPTLNGSYIQVLDHMLNIARTCGISRNVTTIRSLLLDLCSECLSAEFSSRSEIDPTKVELRRQAASSYFNCIYGGSLEPAEQGSFHTKARFPEGSNLFKVPATKSFATELQDRLLLCISDASYEVRLSTLKWLNRLLKSMESGGTDNQFGDDINVILRWSKTDLQPTLMQLLAVETNPRCIYYILRNLFTWNLLQFRKAGDLQCKDAVYVGGDMEYDSVIHFWDKLVSLNKVSKPTKTREILLRCMGICMKRFAGLLKSLITIDQSEKWGHIYGCIDSYVILIKRCSASSEPVNMRRAAAESMVASGLLEEAVSISSFISSNEIPSEEQDRSSHFDPSKAINMYARRILDLWFTCIKMLEDEDVGLRQALAMDVQSCIDSKGSVPAQVEKVIGLTFDFLSSLFGHWIEYFDCLSGWVLDSASCVIAGGGDLVRRVFDKEIDNHHEEQLLICQICCTHLEKISIMKPWAAKSSNTGLLTENEIMGFFQKWRMRYLRQLILFAVEFLKTERGVDWIGGAGNHKDAFISLYASLLGLYALSQCAFEDSGTSLMESEIHKPLLSGFVELNGVIRPFLRNPLILNLYLLVIQSHERICGVSLVPLEQKPKGDGSVWEGFDPYFLLR